MAKQFHLRSVVWCEFGWQPVRFGFAPTEAALHDAVTDLGLKTADHPYPDSYGCCIQIPAQGHATKACCIVTVHDDCDDAFATEPWLVCGLIAHEAMHVWQFICETMGEGMKRGGGFEVEAHAMQHITGQLINAYMVTRGKEVIERWQKAPPKAAAKASRRRKAAATASRPRRAAR